MAAQALVEDLAWPSSVLKELAETMKTFSTFCLHIAHYFQLGKTLIDCISSSLTYATVTSWQGGQTTVHGPHAAHKCM